MKEPNLYRLEITLKSPLLVGYTAPSHNLYDTLNYIPSVTLRGALGTAIIDNFCKKGEEFGKCDACELKDDCEFYKFIYQNVFSITNGIFRNNLGEKHKCQNSDIVPSHPLLQICKVCGKVEGENVSKKIYNNLPLWQNSKYVKSNCPNCERKTTMEPLKKNYCRNEDCNIILGSPEMRITTSTSIDHAKRSSLKGYLFSYNYIQSEAIFESYLLFEKNDQILEFLKTLKVLRIGRGKSRGFGRVSLKIEALDLKEKIKRNKQLIKEMISGNSLILSAKTNVFSLETDFKTNIGLVSNPKIDLKKALQRSNEELNLNLSNIKDIFTLKNTLGSLEVISGWSFKTQQPKPHIKTAVPGSLYRFEINDDNIDENIIEALAYLEFIGLNKYSRLGYNLIYYPSLKEEPSYE